MSPATVHVYRAYLIVGLPDRLTPKEIRRESKWWQKFAKQVGLGCCVFPYPIDLHVEGEAA